MSSPDVGSPAMSAHSPRTVASGAVESGAARFGAVESGAVESELFDQHPFLADLVAKASDTKAELDAGLIEAQRVLGPASFERFVSGAGTLWQLRRDPAIVLSYVQAMPLVVVECGEGAIGDSLLAAAGISSVASAATIVDMFITLPVAARSLGDEALMRSYLGFVRRMAATCPRGVRPLFGHLDVLLSKLTLGGLRSWAEFGAQNYRRDYDNLTAYFDLRLPDSLAMVESERRGVLFVTADRHLRSYLRALWGFDFVVRPIETGPMVVRPYVEDGVLFVPDAVDESEGFAGLEMYRAMLAHLVSHQVYGPARLTAGEEADFERLTAVQRLTAAQRFFVGLVEDARIEWQAVQRFPGLGPLWSAASGTGSGSQETEHEPEPDGRVLQSLERLIVRLRHPQNEADVQSGQGTEADAVAADGVAAGAEVTAGAGVAEGETETGDAWLSDFTTRFFALSGPTERGDAGGTYRMSLTLGLELFEFFDRLGPLPSLRRLQACVPGYRNDVHTIWYSDRPEAKIPGSASRSHRQKQRRFDVGPLMMAHNLDCELAGDDAQEVWTCRDLMRVYEDDLTSTAATFNVLIGQSDPVTLVHYPEWDYRALRYRPNWVSVYENAAPGATAQPVDELLAAHAPLVRQVRRIVDQLTPTGVVRQRRVEDGDELDLGRAIDAMVALRIGETPSRRIMRRNVIKRRDVVIEVLLDLSESTTELVPGSSKSVLRLILEASTLLAVAIEGVGDPFSLVGFSSDGRHDVRYIRFKDFAEPFDGRAKARLAGMSGGLSTRMGAALRHAGGRLAGRPEGQKLVLLLTDGMPSDIDEPDQHHLVADTKKAVEELRARGVATHCLTIDSGAGDYAEELFGLGGFTALDQVERLPEVLPRLFAQLTKSSFAR